MPNKFSMDDYIDVAERIQNFKQAYPDGSLQTVDRDIVQIPGPSGDRTFIVYQAAAFRTPDDVRPGHGTAWEPFPGPTPYTRDSELMNAETAAWGRAIVALGLTANRKIASRQEVRARVEGNTPQQGWHPAPPMPAVQLEDSTVQFLVNAKKASGVTDEWTRLQLIEMGVSHVPEGRVTLPVIRRLSSEQADELLSRFERASK